MSATVQSSRRRRASRIARRGTASARASNERILALIRPGTQEKLPFSCECGMPYCNNSVWLTLQEASKVLERGDFIIGEHFFHEIEAHFNQSRSPG